MEEGRLLLRMYLDPHTYILFPCFCYSAFFMVRELSIAAEAYKSYENLKGSILQGTPLCLRKLPYIYTFKIFFFCTMCHARSVGPLVYPFVIYRGMHKNFLFYF